jgi:ABC-type amino acid transport substrate-binding protein/heat shock protein HslJ
MANDLERIDELDPDDGPPEQFYTLDDEEESPPRSWTDWLLWALLGAALLIAALLIYLLFFQDDGSGNGGGSVLPPTQSPGDNSWNQVRTSGRMVVGTSLDYPPFSFRNQQFQPDGFDVALIREIAGRLGVGAEIKDMAFDSLFDALTLGQIDVAIAAISVTPEREQIAEFSNIYYVGEEGILARTDSDITAILSLSDMAGRRIGVQRGSVYETWLQRDLIATGISQAGNLFVYETADAAVRDLRQQRLDLVVLDLRPAQVAVSQGDLIVAGQGLNPQRFAIAVRKGANALRAQIDSALVALHNEGRMAQLAETYLNIPAGEFPTPPPPTVTPGVPPTATSAAPPTPGPCVNGMRFVADLNLSDQNMQAPPPVSPGQPFSKGWRILNSGTCSWNPSFRLVFVGGNTPAASMGGQPTPVQAIVTPGQQYDIFVNLVAPLAPGVYQGIWQMVDAQNQPFGDRIWVGITVPAAPTATPPATQTPSPSIQFTVDRTNILQGECVNFSWNVQNATAVYFYPQGEAWQNNQVPPQSSRVTCPSQTTNFYLRVQKPDGTVEERSITITVRPNVNAPNIAVFVANPSQVTVGQCVNIQWDVQGSVDRVTISNQFRTIWDNAPTRGNTQDCTGAPTVIEYKLVANGPGGSSQALQYVTVVSPATATSVATVPPSQPVIDAFEVAPPQIQTGQCVQITWRTSGGTWLVRLLRNNVLVLDNAALVGSAQDCLPTAATYTYQLVASTAGGESTSRNQSVLVSQAPPENPLAGKNYDVIAINNNPILAATTITTSFGADGRLNGSGGCNTYSAAYTVSGSQISIGEVSSSQTFCSDPPGVMEQETLFFTTLRSAVSFAPLTETLVALRNAAGQEILRLSFRAPEPR